MGWNLQDTFLNISAVPFFIGLLVPLPLITVFVCFGLGFAISLIGLAIYFLRENKKVSKPVWQLNKWSSFVIIIFLWMIVGIRFLTLLILSN